MKKTNNAEIVVSGINISATVTENTIKVVSKYRCNLTMMGIYPAIDRPAMFTECKKMYSKMLKIGVKDEYSEEEMNYVNAFFAISTFANYKTPNIIDKLKADYVTGNHLISGHPHSFLTFNNKVSGFENVYKSVFFTDENWIDNDNICQSKCNMTIDKLTATEIREFIKYCQLHTFNTFNLIVASYKQTQ